MSVNNNITKSNGTQVWRPFLSAYRDEELSALTFDSDERIYAAIDLLGSDALRGMPFALAGGDSMIVPKNAVSYFRDAGIPFDESALLDRNDLSADELKELRKQFIY